MTNVIFSTSPSIYLGVVGTAYMHDKCGPIGPVITRTTIALPSGTLSTLSCIGCQIGQALESDWTPVTAPLNLADLANPTWGIGLSTSVLYDLPGFTLTESIVGPPFNPIIVPPAQLLSLVPEWLSCSSFTDIAYGIYDPPYALTPDAILSPLFTSSTPAATHASTTLDTDPPASSKPTPGSTQMSPFASKTTDPQTTTNEPSQLQPVSGPRASTAVPSASPSSSNLTTNQQDLSSDPSSTAAADTGGSSTSPAVIVSSTSQNIGAIIYSAFGGSFPGSTASTIAIPTSGPMLVTAGGEDVSVIDPSAIIVQGSTYTEGGKAATISGEVISVAVSTPSIPPEPSVVTIGSQTVIVAPSALVLASTTMLPGGTGLTISGTPISLESSGVLLIGSSTIALNRDPVPTSGPVLLTVGTQIITAGPSNVIVDGTTLTAGGAGITVAGTPITIEPSGSLIVGTSAIAIKPVTGTATPATNATILPFTGSGGKLEMPRWWMLVMIVII